MGSRGGSAPNPYTQRQLSTLFLRVPFGDWPAVKFGFKTEFRARPDGRARIVHAKTPTPVVAYAVNGVGEHDATLMVLEDHWREPLMTIGGVGAEHQESLKREGFESYDEFRRYFRKRMRGVYRPMDIVHVFRIAPWPWDQADGEFVTEMGRSMVRHLYGEFMS